MVKVKLEEKEGNEWVENEIYLDGYIKSNLDVAVRKLHKDFDQVWFIDGAEGGGKSNLAVTLAYYVNPKETRHTLIDRICPNAEKLEEVIMNSNKYDAVVLDESYGGMASTGAMTKLNRMLQKMFTEIRARNLFIFILMPSFMDASRYFAIWRSTCLVHVYTKKDDRGFAAFFNDVKKKKLYILGKKQFYNYSVVTANFVFRFTNELPNCVDEAEYKRRKLEAHRQENKQELSGELKKTVYKEQLMRREKEKLNITNADFAKLCGVTHATILNYLKDHLSTP